MNVLGAEPVTTVVLTLIGAGLTSTALFGVLKSWLSFRRKGDEIKVTVTLPDGEELHIDNAGNALSAEQVEQILNSFGDSDE